MVKQLPVIAAIPNYNTADGLNRLLPTVVNQGYDKIFVLDDASHDNSREVVNSFRGRVQFVAGKSNLCSSGNRNRVLEVVRDNAIIHFLDADTEIASDNTPDKLRTIFLEPEIGFVGGLVLDASGRQSIWNYGPLFGIYNTLTAWLQWQARERQSKFSKAVAFAVRPLLKDWPDPLATPAPRKVGWVLEANMAIRRDTFARLGGFDPNVRSHDIVDLSIKAARLKLKNYFYPSFAAVQHNDIQVRPANRQQARRQATRYLVKKYGLAYWLLPK